MSKCTLRIEFQQPQREVRGGDSVSGTAHVTVSEDTNCKEVRIEYYWKTHGRGDVDRGAVGSQQLMSARRLTAGEYFKMPFSFIAPCDPLSYHGRMLNVDHYVKLIVDIPWATNITVEEEFLLLPGRKPDYLPAQRNQVALERPASPQSLGWLGRVGIGLLVLVFGVAMFMMAMVIIPFVMVGGAAFLLHRYLVNSRVGDVTLRLPHLLVGPEEPFPVEMSFTPKWNLAIDGVFVKIQAQEHCETGTGTDKRTYRETIFEQQVALLDAQTLTAGELVKLSQIAMLPPSKAYSFKAADNQVKWTAEVRISIPRWPDWVETVTLQMVPAEFLTNMPAAIESDRLVNEGDRDQQASIPAQVVAPSQAAKGGDWTRDEQVDAPEYAANDSETETQVEPSAQRADEDQPVAMADSLEAVLHQVMRAERVTSARQAVIDLYAQQVFPADVRVERTYSTYGQDDDRYNDGRTIIGKLAGTQHTVRLLLLARPESESPRLSEGEHWQGDVRILHWDGLYQRADLFEQ